jgi:hypothetical protein
MYEYGTLKPYFKQGSGGRGRIMEGMSHTKVQYMYIWKPLNNYHRLIKKILNLSYSLRDGPCVRHTLQMKKLEHSGVDTQLGISGTSIPTQIVCPHCPMF